MISLAVPTEYRRVTDGQDGQTNGQTDILPRHSPRYAYASRGKIGQTFTEVMPKTKSGMFFLTHSV